MKVAGLSSFVKEEGREEQLEEEQEENKSDVPETVAGTPEEGTTASKQQLFVQYRGKASEDFARALHKAEAPCTVVFTVA